MPPLGQVTKDFRDDDRFDSFDTFLDFFPEGAPGPIDAPSFGFDPSALQRQAGSLSSGGTPFSQLLEQSTLEGIVGRADARFPDFSAFRQERLGGIANQARAATNQLRQLSAGQFFGPGGSSFSGGNARSEELQFLQNIGTAGQASAIENAVEEGRREKATFLGQLDLGAGLERGRLATSAAGDQLGRDVNAASLFSQAAGLQNAGQNRVAGLEQFNRTFPTDFASRAAGFRGDDLTRALGLGQLELSEFLGILGIDSLNSRAIMAQLGGDQETVSQFGSDALDFFRRQEAQDAAGGSGGGSQTGFGFGGFNFNFGG